MKKHLANLISFVTQKNVFYSILAIYLLINLVYILLGQLPFTSDSLFYYEKAIECINHNTFYPAPHNYYDQYIQSPLYVNFLILILEINSSPFTILVSNVLLNFLQITLIYTITKKLFGEKRSARVSVLIYVFYLTNLGAVLLNLTEFLFISLILTAFYLYLKTRPQFLILSGVAIGLAFNIKQIGVLLLISFLITSFYLVIKKAEKTNFVYLLLGFVITILIIGFTTQARFNEFIVTPETAAVNLLMGANEDANGSFNADVFEEGNAGFLSNEHNLTHEQKTNFYRKEAVAWISENPVQWIMLLPLKFMHMYAFDDWSILTLTHTTDLSLQRTLKHFLFDSTNENIFKEKSILKISVFVLIHIYHYIFYYLLAFIIVKQFFNYWRIKRNGFDFRLLPIYIFTFLGTAATLIGVGAARYKYPFIVLLILTIAPTLKNFAQRSTLTYNYKE